jgi:hypothetical protein
VVLEPSCGWQWVGGSPAGLGSGCPAGPQSSGLVEWWPSRPAGQGPGGPAGCRPGWVVGCLLAMQWPVGLVGSSLVGLRGYGLAGLLGRANGVGTQWSGDKEGLRSGDLAGLQGWGLCCVAALQACRARLGRPNGLQPGGAVA